MSLWNNEQISLALNCKITSDFKVERVIIDSRKVEEGDLFVAIEGDNFDGNNFISEAISNGAKAAITSNQKLTNEEHNIIYHAKGGIHALERLAYMRRKNSKAKIIGVTGSVGKTTVKELLSKVFEDYYKVHKTEGNLNNHIGLPLSIANMPLNTGIGIFEMGMNHAGEISKLSRLAHPNIGVITNIGNSHIEFFDSREGIARAKAEIFDWLDIEGFAVIPSDTDYFSLIETIAENNGVLNILSFGSKINNPVETPEESISAHILVERYNIPKNACEKFNLNNILACLTVAAQVGVDVDDAIESISSMEQLEGRGNEIKHKTGAVIINDAYNASPESMKNALVKLKQNVSYKRKIAVLGDMLELGKDSEKFHNDLNEHIKELDAVYLYGENMKKLSSNINSKHFTCLESLQGEISKELSEGDVVLIKGSNGSKVWKLIENLKN